MVDEARILRLLRGITDDLAILRRESAAEEARRADPIWLRSVKYTFVTAIEACIDVAQHICSAARLGDLSDLEGFVEQVAALNTEGSEPHQHRQGRS